MRIISPANVFVYLVLSLGIISYVGTEKMERSWKADNIYKDLKCEKYLVLDTRKETVTRCAVECSITSNCTSFFYSKSTKICRLHSIRFYRGPAFPHFEKMTGSKYYFRPCDGNEFTVHGKNYIVPYVSYRRQLDAKISCRKCGGNLAIIEDKNSVLALRKLVTTTVPRFNQVDGLWVSAHFKDSENNFVWRDGQVLQASSDLWYKSQPSYVSAAKTYQKCVAMVTALDFYLDDINCDNVGYFLALCEVD